MSFCCFVDVGGGFFFFFYFLLCFLFLFPFAIVSDMLETSLINSDPI